MRRTLLWAGAAIFLVWEHVALVLWLREAGGVRAGLAHAWAALRDDWLVLLVLTDAGVFTLCALGWLWRDLRRRRATRTARWLWFTGAAFFGAPGFLAYLAERRPTPLP